MNYRQIGLDQARFPDESMSVTRIHGLFPHLPSGTTVLVIEGPCLEAVALPWA